MTAFMAQSGQWFTIFAMAIALGMDAFSLGIGIGLRGVRFFYILKIGVVVAVFHFFMPLMGLFTGQYMSVLLGDIALAAGGILLILLGAHMIFSAVKGDGTHPLEYTSMFSLLLFSLMVSIDSFSVGISLGLFSTDILLTVLIFGLFGGLMSMFGLLLGNKAAAGLGEYGEVIGGAILLAFGVKFLL